MLPLLEFPVLQVDGRLSRFIIFRVNNTLQINPRLILSALFIMRGLYLRARIFILVFAWPYIRGSLPLSGGEIPSLLIEPA